MTKDLLQQRLEKLEADRNQLLANLNAYDGAIQEAKYWLTQLEKQEAPDASTPRNS